MKIIYPTCLVFLARLVITEKNDALILFEKNNYFLENEDFSTPYQIFIKFRYAHNDMEKQTCSPIFAALRSSAKVS